MKFFELAICLASHDPYNIVFLDATDQICPDDFTWNIEPDDEPTEGDKAK